MQRVQRAQREGGGADLRHLGLDRRVLCRAQPGLGREHRAGGGHLKRHAVRLELAPQPFHRRCQDGVARTAIRSARPARLARLAVAIARLAPAADTAVPMRRCGVAPEQSEGVAPVQGEGEGEGEGEDAGEGEGDEAGAGWQ